MSPAARKSVRELKKNFPENKRAIMSDQPITIYNSDILLSVKKDLETLAEKTRQVALSYERFNYRQKAIYTWNFLRKFSQLTEEDKKHYETCQMLEFCSENGSSQFNERQAEWYMRFSEYAKAKEVLEKMGDTSLKRSLCQIMTGCNLSTVSMPTVPREQEFVRKLVDILSKDNPSKDKFTDLYWEYKDLESFPILAVLLSMRHTLTK